MHSFARCRHSSALHMAMLPIAIPHKPGCFHRFLPAERRRTRAGRRRLDPRNQANARGSRVGLYTMTTQRRPKFKPMSTPQRDNRRSQFLTLESAARWRRNAANFRKYNRLEALAVAMRYAREALQRSRELRIEAEPTTFLSDTPPLAPKIPEPLRVLNREPSNETSTP
jgi:hypothetical protein